ncbi:NADPH-dependent FMN reductase [Pallidibacillus pasinlerensis]|uniref:NAD(P)H-dependent oxidoreductase n=1 Tax=Pallidibacillus pasinlerensis TaxID=2703818 RepID=A0ABX0A3N0_9BACI|nr:NAD(P)H-dependent oxidoreductase [Pallidibacillus pasinlerensis]NCU18048.1 NAD(P)H-dependent oxidoreductase [Pallidibacillus pasinlerensis]
MGFFSKLFGTDQKEETTMTVENIKIAVVIGSNRGGRNAEAVAKYVFDKAVARNDEGVTYEIVDIADYDLAFLYDAKTTEAQQEAAKAWSEKMASFDGYVFVTPEYNHAPGAALKNAIDYLNAEVNNKAAGFVGYGSLGGTRAHEQLRLILAELQVATVRTAVTFSLMSDFENMSEFKPAAYHDENINGMLDQVINWSRALKTVR